MNLEPETIEAMKSFFGDNKCCKCGEPAQRIKGSEYFCHLCFPRGMKPQPFELKVYRSQAQK